MQPDWHRLISAWIAQGRHGLTIPFLVGARLIQTGGAANATRVDIEALLREIIEHPVPSFIVYPRWCIDMEAVVMTTYHTDFPCRPNYNLIEFKPSLDGPTSMAVERDLTIRLGVEATQEKIIEALTTHALPFVERGDYSQFWTMEGRQCGPLQKNDLTFIYEALARHQG